MNLALLFEIIQTATGLASGLSSGAVKEKIDIAAELESIVSKTAQFHQDNVGTPIDPASLKVETRIT